MMSKLEGFGLFRGRCPATCQKDSSENAEFLSVTTPGSSTTAEKWNEKGKVAWLVENTKFLTEPACDR